MSHHAPIVAAHKGKGYTERQYAAAMQLMCYAEGQIRRPRGPRKPPPGRTIVDDISPAILDVLSGEMTVAEIARAAGEKLGRNVWPQGVRDRLMGKLCPLVEKRSRHSRGALWRLKGAKVGGL
jgi:hypothetical protein